MFVFNYVPALGSLLAAIPPVLQTLIFFDIQAGLLVAGFFVMLNLSLSSVMEPLILGKRLNLPLTVQLLAFLIWQALRHNWSDTGHTHLFTEKSVASIT